MIKIDRETRVTLNFALKLEDGQLVDSNFDREPVDFEVGDGKLLPGFESRLLGLKAGDEASFTIPPDDAFGIHNEDNIQAF
ncbi:MAG: FKBP-type peptidyl-prolyl cis-trans isomerase, partial [Pseudomonadales bacterium]